MSHITDPNCIFCKIIAGQIPSYQVYEDENHFGFLTIKPHTKGHMLLIPKNHSDDINQMSTEEFQNLFVTGKKLADKIKTIFNSKRMSLFTMGLEVPHTHLHILPVNNNHALDLASAYDLTEEEAQEVLKLYKF